MANCLEFATPWAQPHAPTVGTFAKASRDNNGNPRWLMFTLTVDAAPYSHGATVDQNLYDMDSGTPLGAWRGDNTAANYGCFTTALLGQSTVTIDGEPPSGLFVANGDPHKMITAPQFQRYSPRLSGLQEEYASDFVFAFDVEAAGFVARTHFGSGKLSLSPPRNVPPLLLAMVEGQDVFAYSEVGTAGWGQLYVLRADGTLALLRSNPNAHVATPASDGTRLYWTETYGSMDDTAQQTRTELWSAPYTADPVQLAATARKFAVIPNAPMPLSAVAFGGLVALATRDGISGIFVARLSDGTVISVDPGPGRYFSTLIAVTASELWSIESDVTDVYMGSLTRISLGIW